MPSQSQCCHCYHQDRHRHRHRRVLTHTIWTVVHRPSTTCHKSTQSRTFRVSVYHKRGMGRDYRFRWQQGQAENHEVEIHRDLNQEENL